MTGSRIRLALHWNLRDVALIAVLVFAAALFGILTRPIGFLSAFWPANALLLGAILIGDRRSTVYTWAAAFAAFVAADLITGDTVETTLWLTAANIIGAFCGWLAMRSASDKMHRLDRLSAVAWLLRGSAIAALGAAAAGAYIAPTLLHTDLLTGVAFWFASELVNYIVILPLVLTMPRPSSLRGLVPGLRTTNWWPAVALACSMVAAGLVGGPGAIGIPVPALLWCALTYGVFATSACTVVLCAWLMIAFVDGNMYVESTRSFLALAISVRLGTAMLALAPLTVAAINRARNDLLARLNTAATTDHLTGALSRGEVLARAGAMLAQATSRAGSVGLLMMDVDRFKQVNDRYGHKTGDDVLVAASCCIREVLRPCDAFGRLGGEEFLVALDVVDAAEAQEIAERIRVALAGLAIPVEGAEQLTVTVSIGVATSRDAADLDHMLLVADRALYRAKEAGRDRVVFSGDRVPAPGEIGATSAQGTKVA